MPTTSKTAIKNTSFPSSPKHRVIFPLDTDKTDGRRFACSCGFVAAHDVPATARKQIVEHLDGPV